LAEEGKSIIMISSELPEIISLCDRVIVMYEGKVQGELLNTELSEELIMTYAMGEYKK
jgi:ABC-type sugar transport system ATPase subunit